MAIPDGWSSQVILAVRGLSLAVREDGEDGEDPMGRGEIMGCRDVGYLHWYPAW